jgi:hypothetical protein
MRGKKVAWETLKQTTTFQHFRAKLGCRQHRWKNTITGLWGCAATIKQIKTSRQNPDKINHNCDLGI